MVRITLVTLSLLSILLSVDDLVVGASCARRDAQIPPGPALLIALGSAVSMGLIMGLGRLAAQWAGSDLTKLIGFALLAGLGYRTLVVAWAENRETGLIRKTSYSRWRDPMRAHELLHLGLALRTEDVLEALGLAFAGLPIALTVVLFKLAEVAAVYAGGAIGHRRLARLVDGRLGVIPGVTLILLGAWQLL